MCTFKTCEYCSIKCTKSKRGKYCSRECYNKSKFGRSIFTTDFRKIISERTKKQHASLSKEEKILINKKISESHKYKLSDSQIDIIKNMLKTRLNSFEAICRKAGISMRVFYGNIKSIDTENIFESKFVATPKHIQNLSVEEQYVFIEDLHKLSYHEFVKKYSISEKTMIRLYSFFDVKEKKIYKKETRPEMVVRNILENLGATFKKEKYLDKTIRVDFL